MAKSTVRLCSIALLGASAIHAQENYSWTEFRKAVVTPRSLAMNAAGAGVAQARDATPEWGQGMEGYSKRFASRAAQHAVRGSIRFNVARWRHEPLHYRQSELKGTWPRLKHALVGTFWVPRTDGSGETVNLGMLTGHFGSAAISRAWHPDESRTVGRAMSNASVSIGINTGMNVLREFWPWKKYRP
jgi:hypothetical protein